MLNWSKSLYYNIDIEKVTFMSKDTKKVLIISGVALDVAITVFLFVISIIMLATLPNVQDKLVDNVQKAEELCMKENGALIGYLQVHANDVYLPFFVVPLFILLVVNIAALVIYVKKAGAKKAVEVADLDAAQKEALKAELLKDLSSGSEDK